MLSQIGFLLTIGLFATGISETRMVKALPWE